VQQLDLCAGADFLGVALDGRGVGRAEILLEVVQRYLCRKGKQQLHAHPAARCRCC
jgi:hypothetical protein